MLSRDNLLTEAEAMERLAAVVSYAPDKARLLQRAAELRQRAQACPAPARPPADPPRFGR
jgi:hypothetical protein